MEILRERLASAKATLMQMRQEAIDNGASSEATRLSGKIDGVNLALSYLREESSL